MSSSKEHYYYLLTLPEWIEKRDRIRKRDNYQCIFCGCKKELHVHHTYYLKNKAPWDVPDDCLITLCKSCHEKEHEGKAISSFTKQEKKEKVKKKGSKPKKKNYKMSRADKRLQAKYDDLKDKSKLPPSNYKQLKFKKISKKCNKKSPDSYGEDYEPM